MARKLCFGTCWVTRYLGRPFARSYKPQDYVSVLACAGRDLLRTLGWKTTALRKTLEFHAAQNQTLSQLMCRYYILNCVCAFLEGVAAIINVSAGRSADSCL